MAKKPPLNISELTPIQLWNRRIRIAKRIVQLQREKSAVDDRLKAELDK